MNSLFGFGRPLFRLGRHSGLAFGLGAREPASKSFRRRRRRLPRFNFFASRHGGGHGCQQVGFLMYSPIQKWQKSGYFKPGVSKLSLTDVAYLLSS